MVRKLNILRGGLFMGTLILFAVGAISLSTAAPSGGNAPKSLVHWDEKASNDVAAALHHMHEVANSGDMKTLKNLLVGDDVLITFELSSDNRTPVPLRSKKDIDKFMEGLVQESGDQNATVTLDMPVMKCRATSTFGVCTEECTVRVKTSKGVERVDKLFGTAVAVKYDDGWKWVQWHMSVGGPASSDSAVAAPATHVHNK